MPLLFILGKLASKQNAWTEYIITVNDAPHEIKVLEIKGT